MSTLTQFFGGGGGNTIIPVELLLVGGGGNPGNPAGATSFRSGGGGGGQVVFYKTVLLTGTKYIASIGAGGGNPTYLYCGDAALTRLTAGGGGDGGGNGSSGTTARAGSGGGGGTTTGTQSAAGGGPTETPGETRTTSFPFFEYIVDKKANNGATGNASYALGGPGGGAGGSGSQPITGPAPGGVGFTTTINGSSTTFAAGGSAFNGNGANGAANTGNGGAGYANGLTAGVGGSGIIVIAYPDIYDPPSTITGAYTQPTRSGFRVIQFTGAGSFII
jgi:hypothetical protein